MHTQHSIPCWVLPARQPRKREKNVALCLLCHTLVHFHPLSFFSSEEFFLLLFVPFYFILHYTCFICKSCWLHVLHKVCIYRLEIFFSCFKFTVVLLKKRLLLRFVYFSWQNERFAWSRAVSLDNNCHNWRGVVVHVEVLSSSKIRKLVAQVEICVHVQPTKKNKKNGWHDEAVRLIFFFFLVLFY